jgi:SSS family solute:Na+ symporter
MQFKSIMDYVQALFSFFIAPLFATVFLGMMWKRATKAAGFWGLLAGTATSVGLWAWVKFDTSPDHFALSRVALYGGAKDMSENVYRAIWSWLACAIVTVIVSLMTKPKTDAELTGLVYGIGAMPHEEDVAVWKRPLFWAAIVFVVFVALNVIFW